MDYCEVNKIDYCSAIQNRKNKTAKKAKASITPEKRTRIEKQAKFLLEKNQEKGSLEINGSNGVIQLFYGGTMKLDIDPTKGDIKSSKQFDSNNRCISFDMYKFDDNGNLIEEKSDILNDGKLDLVRKYEYDKNGNLLKRMEDSDADGIFQTITEYNSKGQVIKISRDLNDDGEPDIITEYKYDKKGKKVQVSRLMKKLDKGAPYVKETEHYDQNGNKIKVLYET